MNREANQAQGGRRVEITVLDPPHEARASWTENKEMFHFNRGRGTLHRRFRTHLSISLQTVGTIHVGDAYSSMIMNRVPETRRIAGGSSEPHRQSSVAESIMETTGQGHQIRRTCIMRSTPTRGQLPSGVSSPGKKRRNTIVTKGVSQETNCVHRRPG